MSKNYFPSYESECNCGCGTNNVNKEHLDRLNLARSIAGIPFPASSFCRCQKHNDDEGGRASSSHVSTNTRECCATDITITSSRARYLTLNALVKAGFTRIGVAKTFIHVDSDKNKPDELVWLY